jgi:phage-related minor tail protein
MAIEKSDFDKLLQQIHQQAKKAGVKRSEVANAIKQVRKQEQDRQSGIELPQGKP